MSESKKINVNTIMDMKGKGNVITALTAYDFSFARIFDKCGLDVILVGDSLGMVFCGNENTLSVSMENMIYHTQAVRKGVKNALLVADMPFMSYQASIEDAIKNAGKLLQAGAEAVKIEGGEIMMDIIESLVDMGIPVMAHVGLMPQYKNVLGGYKVQGKTASQGLRILDDAIAVEEAGAFAVVLEGIPDDLAKKITKKLTIPTIGIGAGPYCDGQIMVCNDILGLSGEFSPKFVKKYADGERFVKRAVKNYLNEVKDSKFPSEVNSYRRDKVHLHPVLKQRKIK